MAGFCTGIVDKKDIIDGKSIKPGDRILGIESSGLHSNGYSLVNYLLTRHQIFYADHPELLTPTTIYAPVVKRLLSEMDEVYGMAHITGGGIPENLPRCLPKGLKAHIDWNAWRVPEIFKKIQLKGNVDELEMRRVFNLGIGYCVIVPADREEFAMDVIGDENLGCWEIGEVYETK
jgi:phosphoribosylformylglycinamidine cyclo-ligase